MVTVNFVTVDGTRHKVKLAPGANIMRGAVDSGLDGIVAECGGNAMCATCHVYVDDAWLGRLPELEDVEDAMLDETVSPRTTQSRLSCQITANPEIDGITVHIPSAQV